MLLNPTGTIQPIPCSVPHHHLRSLMSGIGAGLVEVVRGSVYSLDGTTSSESWWMEEERMPMVIGIGRSGDDAEGTRSKSSTNCTLYPPRSTLHAFTASLPQLTDLHDSFFPTLPTPSFIRILTAPSFLLSVPFPNNIYI